MDLHLKKRQEEHDRAWYKDEAKRRGYDFGYRMKNPENFVLIIYDLRTYAVLKEVPFVATMQEYPSTIAHLLARKIISAMPDLTVAPEPKPLDLTGAVQLSLV